MRVRWFLLIIFVLASSSTITAQTNEEALLVLRHDYLLSVYGAVWNQDETKILTWSNSPFLGDQNIHKVRLWDAITGDMLLVIPLEEEVFKAQWSADETRVLTVSNTAEPCQDCHFRVQLWDAVTGKLLLTVAQEDSINSMEWSADETRLLTASNKGIVRVWNISTGTAELDVSFSTGTEAVTTARWNHDETQILAASWYAETVGIWNANTGANQVTLNLPASSMWAAWSPDETQVATWGKDNTVLFWDLAHQEVTLTLSHPTPVDWILWHPYAPQVLTICKYGNDNIARVWDSSTGELLLSLPHEAMIGGARWNADGTRILTWTRTSSETSTTSTIRVWDGTTGEVLFTLNPDNEDIISAKWNKDETRLLLNSEEGNASVWEVDLK
jgi:WD40 repeat protein